VKESSDKISETQYRKVDTDTRGTLMGWQRRMEKPGS